MVKNILNLIYYLLKTLKKILKLLNTTRTKMAAVYATTEDSVTQQNSRFNLLCLLCSWTTRKL